MIILVGFYFGVGETIYFGSNFMPETIGKMVCDFLSTLTIGIGLGVYLTANYLHYKFKKTSHP
jgi:uncharacterized membrane protein YczE